MAAGIVLAKASSGMTAKLIQVQPEVIRRQRPTATGPCRGAVVPRFLIGFGSMNFVDILNSSCALFLDFDGTLVDLAAEPGAVVVPSSLVNSLSSLNTYLSGAIAVISGRPIEQIDAFL